MAHSLLSERNHSPVGKNWAGMFAERQPELKFNFDWNQSYKRAGCEDTEVVLGWFHLLGNVKAKHGILDEDTYDFDASGFMTGFILTETIAAGSEYLGWPNAVQQGNREWTGII